MGMFDWVNVPPQNCKCGEPLKEWQSKDAKCEFGTVEYCQVDNFYTSCFKCETWYEYHLKRDRKPTIPIADYDLYVNHEKV